MPPTKTEIRISIDPSTGALKVDNSKNSGTEKAILDELAELAEFMSGDPTAFQVEKHVGGNHSHTHTHSGDHVHA